MDINKVNSLSNEELQVISKAIVDNFEFEYVMDIVVSVHKEFLMTLTDEEIKEYLKSMGVSHTFKRGEQQ